MEEYNSVYDVDLAILDAVRQGGGGGGGVTTGQVQTMIDSALTGYSTTQQVNGMIASGTSGLTTTQQVSGMIASGTSGFTTEEEVGQMISASAATKQDNVWDNLEITADGTVTGGNGYWIYNAVNDLSYKFGNDYEAIKCQASGQTYFGRIISKVHYEGENDIWEFTGVITIADITYVGVWGVDGTWAPYKKSFTQLGAGGGAGKQNIYVNWDDAAATSAETAQLAVIVEEAREMYLSGDTTLRGLTDRYNIYMYDSNNQSSSVYPLSNAKYHSDDDSQVSEHKLVIQFVNPESGMFMYLRVNGLGAYSQSVNDVSGILNSKLSGMGVAMVRALTQQEYDDEGYYDPTTLYIIKPSNNP